MAESQTLPVPSADQHEVLTCALCLDVYREPMLLPCSHTFCLRCLKDLTEKTAPAAPQDGLKESSPPLVQSDDAVKSASPVEVSKKTSFPCPTCRTDVAIPEDGAVGFRLNVSIDPKDLFSATDLSHCSEHQGKIMTMFCMECDVIICRKCKTKHHIHHKSQNIEDTAVNAEAQLSREKVRIQELRDHLEKNVNRREQDLTEFEAKKAVVEREILQRYNKIIAQVQKYRDDAVAALHTCSNDKLTTELNAVRQNLNEARYLCQRIEQAETMSDHSAIVTVSKEMTSGSGSEAAVKKLKEIGHLNQACRPVHRSALPDDDFVFQAMKTFIGTCEVVTLPRVEEQEPGLVGKEEFQCGDHDDVTVFSLKAKSNKDFSVSFDPFYHNQLPPAKRYHQQQAMFTLLKDSDNKEGIGRRSFTFLDGIVCYSDFNINNILFCKKKCKTFTFKLKNESNVCVIGSIECVSTNWSLKELFTIQSKSCRAFDVDQSQQYFVVVEEVVKPATQRKVLLYRRPATHITVTAVDTYTSPITPFQPADVCFYTLLGQQVLVIADEANDSLHVAEVKDDRVTFTRFLCPGCPLLLQPTALDNDHEGRLWVGCRGGRIVNFPVSLQSRKRWGEGLKGGPGRYGGKGPNYYPRRGGGYSGQGRRGGSRRGGGIIRGEGRLEEEEEEEADVYWDALEEVY